MTHSSPRPCLGIIGGSGLYEIDGLTDVTELRVDTPYGAPSDVLVSGEYQGTRLLFMPRHGRGHRVPPHAINYRANVCALKMSGATHVMTVSAVGSMKEEIAPGDMVVVDQFVDLTKRRVSTFFDEGVAAHVGFADPICNTLAATVADAASAAIAAAKGSSRVHRGGTYVCIDGPQFSTRAESLIYRSWGVSVIGMTAMPEAKLAREAELPYACLALSTDYDCWHASEEDVTVEAVIATLKKNISTARATIAEVARRLPDVTSCRGPGALNNAIMTSREAASSDVRERLAWLVKPGVWR